MYAIVEIAGQQFKAEKGRKLYVHRLAESEGSVVSCRQVMLIDNDGKVRVGAPIIEDAAVEIEVLRHLKDDKVIVFKKNRRKGYRVKNGHRQCLTQVLIKGIAEDQAPVVQVSKPSVAAVKVVDQVVEATVVVDKPVASKVVAVKPAVKKVAAKPVEGAAKKPVAKRPATPKTDKTK